MDIDRAKEIVSALAEGIDPTTGELLPEDNVYNKGDIVRALYTVLTSLDAKKPKKNLPEMLANVGPNKTIKSFVKCSMRMLLRKISVTLLKEPQQA